ncbi:alpha-N-acetylglucosaminidase [Streptomyces sp. NBC_01257]|uniref:alpha-N-acetylglucosaminidase n=1 Tax=Streptomyces sp. NBC_01257 TaxID=2903799 RepID=UPI002DDB3D6B|nr:alpha-N-acetylglucosaminidase [Streptomyces sp. NBC_01257]WRZ64605.1 alpha-N-acetylglucosaminidase C-terminal domain-containing protein [Streptomyces sp. NBC_01257]
MTQLSRRTLLTSAGAVGVTAALGTQIPAVAGPAREAGGTAAAHAALERLLGAQAGQFRLTLLDPADGGERFRIGGRRGRVEVAGTSPAVLLTGVHWYLKYVCDAVISWAGSQLDLPAVLPAPARPLERRATVPHRFTFNDTYDGYTAPYADWSRWERTIDVLALHGCNEVFLTVGQEAVYHRVMQEFGYSDAETRAWIPAPTHQPWWLLQNMSGYGGPLGPELIARRAALGRRAADRMRELGMAPVLPGYFGTVPGGFADRNPGAAVVPQGQWSGFRRPDWLDPRTDTFARVAESFYRHQRVLFDDVPSYKMDILHEGGSAGGVDIPEAARGIERALQTARPGATWVIMGWTGNPRRELLDALDKTHVLIVDGRSELDEATDREKEWGNTPYAFGAIPNFGGRTTLGAMAPAWTQKFPAWRDKAGSTLSGTAYLPESTDRDPAAFELFTELAWREEPVDRAAWFTRYARFRYGGRDGHAAEAFAALRDTAYDVQSSDGRPHDSLFAARPDLAAVNATYWGTTQLSFDSAGFDRAFAGLLRMKESLRRSEAYRFDLTDFARQALANRSRQLLPQLHAAYARGDRAAFAVLSGLWLKLMRLSDEMTGGHRAFMLGPWLDEARRSASSPAEAAQLEHSARALITTWADRPAADGGLLANYANRDWQGLIADFHLPQWQTYLDEMADALAHDRAPEVFDWYAVEEPWTHERKTYPLRELSARAAHRTALRVYDTLAAAPYQGTVTVAADRAAVPPGGSAVVEAGFRNVNGLRATGPVRFLLGLPGLESVAQGPVELPGVEAGGSARASWRITAPQAAPKEPLEAHPFELRTRYGPRGERPVTAVVRGQVYVAGPLEADWLVHNANDASFGRLADRFAIDGAGRDLWGATAEFGAVYRAAAFGEGGSVTVRVDSQENTGNWARAGLVVRNAMPASGSRGFLNLALTPANGVVLSYDANGDGTLEKRDSLPGVQGPVLLRLTRSGASYTGSCSTDGGASWRAMAAVTVPGAAAVQDVGFFMTAANGGSGRRGRADFSGWSLTG